MTEYFRITGLHNINFDEGAQAPPVGRYRLILGNPPTGLSKSLTRQEVLMNLERLPKGIRGYVLSRTRPDGDGNMSIITIPMNIQGGSDADMEDAEHDLNETLIDAALYIETEEARGTRAVLRVKADAAVENSYKTIYHGVLNEASGRDTLGAKIKEHLHGPLVLTIYCEGKWRPETAITLGPNEIYCPSFEEDGNADGTADDWTALNVPVLAMETTIVLHGCDSQKVTTNLVGEGIASATMAAPAAPANDAIAYAWVCRVGAGTDIRAVLRDTTVGADMAIADYDAATVTAVGKSGETWKRLELVVTNTIVPANNHQLWVYSRAATVTDWYVDKCYLKWDTVTIPDEWCDHGLIYNHYDTTEGAAHEGHINYFDVDDLKGDVDARLLMRVEYEKIAEAAPALDLMVARRTKEDYCGFLWWLEAENANVQTLWADLGGLALCSAGDCVSNNANVTGFINWVTGITAGFDLPASWGRFDVYGAVYTDDPTNTQYRLSYSPWGAGLYYNNWVKQTQTSVWELIYLGEVVADMFTRAGNIFWRLAIRLDYEKDAADTVRADFIWLVPKDEPEMLLYHPESGLAVGEYWAMSRAEDFDYAGHEVGAVTETLLWLKGDAMTLVPRLENRLYFVCISPDRQHYEAHRIAGPANALEMIVNIDYLPQFISPME